MDDASSSEPEDTLQSKTKCVRILFHVEQKYNWDCGVSAVAMCLTSTQRQQLMSNLSYFCRNDKTGFGTSTWTIDLCYLLSYFGIKHIMYTTSLGVNPELGQETFYSSILDRDTERVSKLFLEREKHGIKVVEQCLLLEDLIDLLKSSGPLILLVNANLLFCKDCSWPFIQSCTTCCPVSFQGHYILVIGYDLDDGIIYYRNPGLSDRICSITFTDLDFARSSFGTDNDVIVIEENLCALIDTQSLELAANNLEHYDPDIS